MHIFDLIFAMHPYDPTNVFKLRFIENEILFSFFEFSFLDDL